MFDNRIRITAIGDVFPGELPYTIDFGIKTQFENHHGVPWKVKLRKILGESDLVIGNLESPLINAENSRQRAFLGNPNFVDFLYGVGINVLNIANNHILEQGDIGFQSTIEVIRTAGIDVVGYIENSTSKILYKTVKDIKIAIAGFSSVDLEVINDYDHFPVLNSSNVLDTLDLMKKSNSDIKILSFHWGNEYVHIPSVEQRKLAYLFIDNGADLIIGHHPHVIQPVEKYKNRYIFYSLGNFIFDFNHSEMVRNGLVGQLTFDKKSHALLHLKGVYLSYRNTIDEIPHDKFQRLYDKIYKLYLTFLAFSEEKYRVKYRSMHGRNRMRERIFMKLYLLSQLCYLPLRKKHLLIKNVLSYYRAT